MSKIIYGFHSINAYIESDYSNIEIIYLDITRHDRRVQSLLELAQSLNVAVTNITANELDKLTKTKNNQGVAARVKLTNQFSLKEVLAKLAHKTTPQVLILDGITDPQNLGARIRTAECFGVDAIILPKNNSANINNAIVAKVSSGAINNLAIIT
ncbi:MAG: 23S rRNA (guanosine(2251)-2'-O)-methyltransferase RlmB, partial [Burkholderiales bacterium]|nr:23S rRNA (guanosine(2251)-2'-O)-methyltransferase RlmB [Burkholderiales bacterium]